MAQDSGLPEIESFNMLELDVSGLDMGLELTTLMPRLLTPDCGPSYGCSCYSNCGSNCSCHGNCSCHTLCVCNGYCSIHL